MTGAEKALHIPVLSVKNPYAALFYHFCKSFEARTKAMLQSLEGRYMLLHVSQPCRGDEKKEGRLIQTDGGADCSSCKDSTTRARNRARLVGGKFLYLQNAHG